MSEFIQKRPLVVFFALVVVNMFLLSVQVRNQEGRILLRSWGLQIFSPLASALHFQLIQGGRLDRFRSFPTGRPRNSYWKLI